MPTDEKCPKCGGVCETYHQAVDPTDGCFKGTVYRSTAQQRIKELEAERDRWREECVRVKKRADGRVEKLEREVEWFTERCSWYQGFIAGLRVDTDPVLEAAMKVTTKHEVYYETDTLFDEEKALRDAIAKSKRCTELQKRST